MSSLHQDLEDARLEARQAACEHQWWNASHGCHEAIAKCEHCDKIAYNMLAHLHPDDPREIHWRQRLEELRDGVST